MSVVAAFFALTLVSHVGSINQHEHFVLSSSADTKKERAPLAEAAPPHTCVRHLAVPLVYRYAPGDPTEWTVDAPDAGLSDCIGTWVLSSYPRGDTFTDTEWYEVRHDLIYLHVLPFSHKSTWSWGGYHISPMEIA